METTLLIVICVLLLIAIVLIIVFRNKSSNELPLLQNKVTELQTSLSKIETNLKEDFHINREENANMAKDNRKELNDCLLYTSLIATELVYRSPILNFYVRNILTYLKEKLKRQ